MERNSSRLGTTAESTPMMRRYSSDHVSTPVARSNSKLPSWAVRCASAKPSQACFERALAVTRSVMSRAITDSPTISPASSFDDEAVISTSTMRSVLAAARGLEVLVAPPARKRSRIVDCSFSRPIGAISATGCPMISSSA